MTYNLIPINFLILFVFSYSLFLLIEIVFLKKNLVIQEKIRNLSHRSTHIALVSFSILLLAGMFSTLPGHLLTFTQILVTASIIAFITTLTTIIFTFIVRFFVAIRNILFAY